LNIPPNNHLYLLNYSYEIPSTIYDKYNIITNIYNSSKYNLLNIAEDLTFTIDNHNDIKNNNIIYELSNKLLPVHVYHGKVGCVSYNSPINFNCSLWNNYFLHKNTHVNYNNFVDMMKKSISYNDFKIWSLP